MSKYLDNDKFLEPQVNQYGRNMVMTNVTRETKRKYINIDTKFRDEYNYNSNANYTISLPDRLTNVKSIMVCTAEIPITYYNISENLGNNFFTAIVSGVSYNISIPDSQYTFASITTAINTAISALSLNLTYGTTSNNSASHSTFHSSDSFILHFDMDATNSFDKYNFKSKLGWLLGFRKQSYTISNATITSECLIDLNGSRYLYLVIDEYTQNNTNSFTSPQAGFLMNKNILARITISPAFQFGSILPANNFNGLLLTDKRSYNGIIDIKRLNIQLVNDIGIPMKLNGIDFSFCLEVEYE